MNQTRTVIDSHSSFSELFNGRGFSLKTNTMFCHQICDIIGIILCMQRCGEDYWWREFINKEKKREGEEEREEKEKGAAQMPRFSSSVH